MADRRTLSDGLRATPTVDPAVARDFVNAGRTGQAPQGDSVARTPVSTRVRADLAQALKRASLERQLKGVEPHTLQDILEQAIEPWLRSNGYLS